MFRMVPHPLGSLPHRPGLRAINLQTAFICGVMDHQKAKRNIPAMSLNLVLGPEAINAYSSIGDNPCT
jgi:hypothetical protein